MQWSRGTKVPSGPAAPQEPAGRQRLNLLPRTAAPAAAPAADAPVKASPFGGARPIDTATREREAEQHLEERRKAAAEAAEAKKAAEAARKEKEAKEKEAREAREAQQRRPVRVHPSRLPPKETPQADADGFETVASSRRGQQQQDDKPATSAGAKPANTKAGFSFAAAAGAIDVEDVADKLAETKV